MQTEAIFKSPTPPDTYVRFKEPALIITRKGKAGTAFFFTFFTVLWSTFVTAWGRKLVEELTDKGGSFDLITVAFFFGLALFFEAVLIYISYYSWTSRQIIVAAPEALLIKSKPHGAWGKEVQINRHLLSQLYVKHYRDTDTHRNAFRLEASLSGQEKPTVLIQGFRKAEYARFFERGLENFYEIEDKAVEGEIEKE